MSKQHILKAQIREFKQRHCIFFDTETNQTFDNDTLQFHHTLNFMIYRYAWIDEDGTLTSEYTRYAEENGQFWNDIIQTLYQTPDRVLYLIAHNQQFDLGIIEISELVRIYGAYPKRVVVEFGKVLIDLIFIYERKRYTLKIRDTMNYYPTSLANLGKIIGEYKLSFPDEDTPLTQWIEYCIQDVNVTAKFYAYFVRFCLSNKFGNVAETLASQALITFKNKFIKRDIFVHDRNQVISLERHAYHGGRVECFYIGYYDKPIYKLDINSMYPYVMMNNRYPVKLVGQSNSIKRQAVMSLIREGYTVIANVTTNLPENSTGVIHTNKKYVFPVGTMIKAYLNTPEFVYNYDNIISVNNVVWYESDDIFSEYVQYFYDKRLEHKHDETLSGFYKLMLNSLYGKFGQRDSVWLDSDDIELEFNTTKMIALLHPDKPAQVFNYRNILGKTQLKNNNVGNSYDAIVSIASHVTAYARCFLYELMKQSGERNTLYVDTDCLFVTQEGYENLKIAIDKTKLGWLKNEGMYTGVTLYGNKDYELFKDDELVTRKTKGIRHNAKPLGLDENGVERYEQTRFSKWSVNLLNTHQDTVTTTEIVKHLYRHYDKGYVGEDGWVTPLVIGGLMKM